MHIYISIFMILNNIWNLKCNLIKLRHSNLCKILSHFFILFILCKFVSGSSTYENLFKYNIKIAHAYVTNCDIWLLKLPHLLTYQKLFSVMSQHMQSEFKMYNLCLMSKSTKDTKQMGSESYISFYLLCILKQMYM